MNIETHLDNLFASGARDRLANSKNKVYEYTLLSEDFSKKEKSGKAVMEYCYYSRSIDCDVLTIRDIDTNESITANTFRINLKEIKD